jgi:hypothetical protein
MRWLGWGLTALVGGWAVWWWVAATAVERAAAGWFDTLRAAGWEVASDSTSVAGFPARLDLTVTGPRLFDPVQGLGWEGAFAQILTLAYRPWHVIAALPPDQILTLGPAQARLRSDRLRASVVVRPVPALPLDRLAVEGDGLALDWPGGAAAAASLRAGMRAAGTDYVTHRAAIAVEGIALAAPDVPVPATGASLRLDATLRLTAPLDRHAGAARPQVAAVDLRSARLTWGEASLTAEGSVAVDADGVFAGRIEIVATDWPTILALAVAVGLVAPEVAPTWARIADALAQGSGTPGTVSLPLTLARGRMSLGPLPLGPAPRL